MISTHSTLLERLPSHAAPGAQVSAPPGRVHAHIVATAQLPTEFGHFRAHVFHNDRDSFEHVALVRGELDAAEDVPTRLHSECLTGDAFASLRCDCRGQLESSLRLVGAAERGIVLYLRQEGRGIGLANKIRAYELQQQGYDTVDANLMLGFAADERDYAVAAAMLRTLGVASVALMTNNPDKIQQLSAAGIDVSRRLAHEVAPNPHNRFYLATKARRAGHLFTDGGASEADTATSTPAPPGKRGR
ncbi:MAG TPA: GTP cyclohydrolase II [Polyangiaceae bacterium]|nr:GTP cyclohydrolase II [Polyangiaceae bacterium]